MRRPDRIDSRTNNPTSGQSAGLYPDDPEQRPPGTPCARRTNPVRSQAIRPATPPASAARPLGRTAPPPTRLSASTRLHDTAIRPGRYSTQARSSGRSSSKPDPGKRRRSRYARPSLPRSTADTAARPLRRPAAAQPHDESADGTRQADLDGRISDSPSEPSRNGSRNTSATSPSAGSAPTKRRRLPISGTAARHGHTGTIRLHVSNPTNRPVCRVIRMRFHALCARSRGCQSAETQELRILRSPFSGRRRRTCGSRWHPHARG